MIDLQHDSPVPIAEQIADQLRAHVASGTLVPGTRLADARALAQELLTHPQAVARAYADLVADGVLRAGPGGLMEVTPGATLVCRTRVQAAARDRLRAAVAKGLAAGLTDDDLRRAVEQELAAARVPPLPPADLPTALTTLTAHAPRHRAATGIQDLSRQAGPRRPDADGPGGGHLRPPRR